MLPAAHGHQPPARGNRRRSRENDSSGRQRVTAPARTRRSPAGLDPALGARRRLWVEAPLSMALCVRSGEVAWGTALGARCVFYLSSSGLNVGSFCLT